MILNGNTLKEWGWPPGPHFKAALERAQALAAEGLSVDAVRAQLAPDLAALTTLLERRRPLPGLIPLNMASPVLLCLGADNEELPGFAPHGAGRNISRTALLKRFHDANGRPDRSRIESAITDATKDIEVRWWYGRPDLSETPLGYKDADAITAQITRFGLGRICGRIDPLGCIMAGDPGPAPWKARKKEPSPKQLRQQAHRADRRHRKQRRWEE